MVTPTDVLVVVVGWVSYKTPFRFLLIYAEILDRYACYYDEGTDSLCPIYIPYSAQLSSFLTKSGAIAREWYFEEVLWPLRFCAFLDDA